MRQLTGRPTALAILIGQLLLVTNASFAQAKSGARKAGPVRPAAPAVRQPVPVAGNWVACVSCSGRPTPFISLTAVLAETLVASDQISHATIMQMQHAVEQNTLTAWKSQNIGARNTSIDPPPLAMDGYEFRYVIEQAATRMRTVPDDSQFKNMLRGIQEHEMRSRNAYEEAARLRESAQRQRDIANRAQSFNQQNWLALGRNTSVAGLLSRGLSTYSAGSNGTEADRYEERARVADQQAREYADAAVAQRRTAALAQANMPMVQRHSVAVRFSCAFRDNLNGTILRELAAQNVVAESSTATSALWVNINAMARRCTAQLPTDGKAIDVRTRVTGIGVKGVTLNGGRQMNMLPGDVFHIVRRQSSYAPGLAVVAKARVVSSFATHAEAEITDRSGVLRAGDMAVWQFRSDPPAYGFGDFGAVAAFNAFLPFSTTRDTIYAGRAAAQARAGDVTKAIADFTTARAGAKTASDFNHLCWEAATSGVLLDLALAACNSAIALAPKNASVLDSRALTMLRMGRLDDAISDYTLALSLSPRLAGSYFGRAVAWARKGNSAMSQADANAAINIEPSVVAEFGGYGISLPGKI